MKQRGFVLIEIVVIVGMMAVFMGLLTMNVLGSQRKASLVDAVDTLLSDIRSQQTKAMTGETVGGAVQAGYGIHFSQHSYTLFNGIAYNAADSTNSVIPVTDPLSFSVIGFPGNSLVFLAKSGEVFGYVSGQDTVVVSHADSAQSRTIHINRYGIVTAVN